jgi:hypothetical protein
MDLEEVMFNLPSCKKMNAQFDEFFEEKSSF